MPDLFEAYKIMVWSMMNEIEKPIMRQVFMQGKEWRRIKNMFLTVPQTNWPLEDKKVVTKDV